MWPFGPKMDFTLNLFHCTCGCRRSRPCGCGPDVDTCRNPWYYSQRREPWYFDEVAKRGLPDYRTDPNHGL
jgi:hypothetical protein